MLNICRICAELLATRCIAHAPTINLGLLGMLPVSRNGGGVGGGGGGGCLPRGIGQRQD